MRRVILAICGTAAALVLLLSFKTHTQTGTGTSPAAALGTPAPGDSTGSAAAAGTAPATADPARLAGPSASSAAGGTKTTKTVTGAAWPTVYGPVQVKVTVSGGKVTAVAATEYPQDTPRDYEINAYAIPQLNAEALAAGSARIDSVSGATYTSQGYIGSLQDALSKAGLS